ncbi:hypothetical protein B0H17DRAFT_1200092 [Mycena rosella]|uniref:Uncharacterized protein n=1 Tax=Mycena rosella TaxID=1033263 RepID=A0AAD7GG35_MYCRO|nr:hypothetical protein B0H17DRAFT_1200092 [Mycena rosella]
MSLAGFPTGVTSCQPLFFPSAIASAYCEGFPSCRNAHTSGEPPNRALGWSIQLHRFRLRRLTASRTRFGHIDSASLQVTSRICARNHILLMIATRESVYALDVSTLLDTPPKSRLFLHIKRPPPHFVPARRTSYDGNSPENDYASASLEDHAPSHARVEWSVRRIETIALAPPKRAGMGGGSRGREARARSANMPRVVAGWTLGS